MLHHSPLLTRSVLISPDHLVLTHQETLDVYHTVLHHVRFAQDLGCGFADLAQGRGGPFGVSVVQDLGFAV